uniref:FAD dependent oxidoreductase n=1 Tax=Cyanothece sp. (strain PCC 7425 / ATCC 29141) TaxID=395961 RepID=B8HRG2_CYAP4
MHAPELRVAIVGAGVIGAAIAYELSQLPDLSITVLDQRSPQTYAATGAALGVLVGAVSPKRKGQHLQLRLASLQRYETLIPELETRTGLQLPYNRQGILQLCFEPEQWQQWTEVSQCRREQGFDLEQLQPEQLARHYPQVAQARSLQTSQPLLGAIYSPQDRQVDPIALTEALIVAAQQQGAEFVWQTKVVDLIPQSQGSSQGVSQIQTATETLTVDWLILAAGLGSSDLTAQLQTPIALQPVLGQAVKLRRPFPLAMPYPVVQGEDVHIVPLNAWEAWVGATVEFPAEQVVAKDFALDADPQRLAAVLEQAIALCPDLKGADILQTWSGLRPRPQGRPAPIIEPLSGYTNVLLATGHYRNGILLAPITALKIKEWIAARP